jgi:predicted metal-dependent phosphoesterase TrpH
MGNHQLAQNTTLLRQIFTNIQPDSCPKHYNFHMHTNCSDGKLAPEDLISQAVQIGLKGMAITDHHSIDGYYRAVEWLQTQGIDSLQLWTGMEITAYLPPVDVHILGYGFDPSAPSLAPYLTGENPEV